ncbi:DUF1302 domain-containing protein [Glaciimonas sp. PCH181]|uniref:DUF1302 domain-containing protein n=1 Tax=Glaciimonas sp. PCH181 TaxID=2133943 RepID=UPI000D3B545C|nr:DUF1302 family protein [Glaciimonas sp. PCH181]PUA18448.1 DUF1302 domain-containing protein [Glaciimonas sp. PCH181]
MKKTMIQIVGAGACLMFVYGQAQADESDSLLKDIDYSLTSNVTAGIGVRTKSPSCTLTGDPNANGCGSSANTAQWANGDNGDLNYKKGQPYTAYASFTSELLMTMPSQGYKFLIRGTGMYDFAADHTQRTPLASDAKSQAVDSLQLLDFWAEKDFSIGNQNAHFRLGNQVINWGESYFASGGINATNSLDIQKLFVPGTQLKQALLPAPMLAFASSLPGGFSTEAYYQFQWNGNKYPPVGTYWSGSNTFGRGASPASINSQNFNVASIDAGTIAGPNSNNAQFLNGVNQNLLAGVYAGPPNNAVGGAYTTVLPGNRPQIGLKLGYKPPGADINFGFYYENYTDKSPVLSFLSNGVSQWSYLQNRSLFGVSTNFALGEWAIGSELSYRPHDAVAMSGCYGAGGLPDANTNAPAGLNCAAYKDFHKIQFDINGQLNMTKTSQPLLKLIGADLGVLTTELTVIRYPGVNANTQYNSTVNGQQVYQIAAAGYGAWLNNNSGTGYPIAAAQGTSNSVGLTIDFNATYDGTLIPGWQVTPGVTFYDAVSGYTPTFSANYESGAKSANFYVLFNQNPLKWQGGINFTAYWGGNAVSQPFSDRNVIGAFVTRNF